MAVTYYAILTAVGAAKLANAAALGTTLQITQMAVGDGNGNVPVPDANRTTLVNEVRRAPLNQLKIDPSNASQIIAEQVIPESVGGWWIREIGLLDNTGALIAIANCAPSYKPQLAEGSGRTQTVRMVLIVNNTGSVELKIDPSVVLATRAYCDEAIATAINRQDAKASVRAATTANIALNGLPTIDGVVLVTGDRVLVKNQGTGSQNGIYVAAVGAWARSADADENAEVTPSLTVSVESGTAQADTIWQLITDAPIVVGTTALVFQDITNGLARLASPALTGTPTAPTAAPGTNTQQLATAAFVQAAIAPLAPSASPVFTGDPKAPTPAKFDNDTSLATTQFVQRALGNFASQNSVNTTRALTLDLAGQIINCSSTITVTLPSGTPEAVGAKFQINNTGSGVVTVQSPAGQNLYGVGNGTPRTFVLGPGDTVTIGYVGGGSWYGWGGIQLGASAGFASSLSPSGYQKLPSGLILNWTSINVPDGAADSIINFTWPLAFPNAALVATSEILGTASARAANINTVNKTGGAINAKNQGTSLATSAFIFGIGW
ncbi:phage tail protein [Pseudomonas nitroreducens]|uniref:Phage tail protein n=1 Tax=Pseudomonas nitroreducens TaxID=46680 RepID=A0A6G6IW39_PSENT|nr:phage tail protein [Pseudomonas nitroreducens]QIE87030.1 phage tail protein [Pseudomonas nitroreducens]